MDVARTSMMHAAAPHFLWPFAVRYAAHQINLHPRVSRPETSPALLWTGKVGDASAFRVWGSRAFVRDLSADKLSPRASPCVFLGFPPDAPGWQFLPPHLSTCSVLQDVTFDESVPYYRLFPYRTPSLPHPRSSWYQSLGVLSLGVLSLGVLSLGVLSLEVPSLGVLCLGVLSLGCAASGGAEPGGAEPGGSCVSGLRGAGGVLLVLVVLRLQRVLLPRVPPVHVLWVLELLGLRVSPGAGTAEGVGAEPAVGGPTDSAPGAAAGGSGASGGAAGGAAGVGTPAGAAGAVPAVSSVAARPRPYFVPLLQQVLGLPPPPPPPLEGPQPVRSQPQLQPASLCLLLLPTLWSRVASASFSCPWHAPDVTASVHMLLCVPLCLLLLLPLFLLFADPESDSLRAASPTVTRLLATAVSDPSFESSAASALVTELVDFAARCRLDYAARLVTESESACPPSVGGECALGTDTSRLHALTRKAIEGPYSSQWQVAMDAEMASWKSTGTYVDAVPPPGANIVSGMWIFRGVDYFQTFSPTPKMTTLRVLLHVAAHRDYELHSLDFSTAFLQGSLHERSAASPTWLHWVFPSWYQWSPRRPVYGPPPGATVSGTTH
ncbi:unnamed protein product [Closterium sp. NIES-64]|nr:unnamed protein product [Closterium sp. NIES-64]